MRTAKLTAAAAALKQSSGVETAAFSLAFMTDAIRTPQPELVARILPAGAALILRHYNDPKRAQLAKRLQSICSARGVLLLIGADAELAHSIGAAGVHCPSWDQNDRASKAGFISSAACHTQEDIIRAHKTRADIAVLSPVFPTKSHLERTDLGVDQFRKIAARSPLPVIALGGVDEGNAARLAGQNIVGLAAIGAFLGGAR